ncbi:MAG: hypothetical protein ACI85O_000566 [Saprospiraceae bacterium]|jgi:hypothetical protein
MIPQTFDEWKNCIINDCKIELTKEFTEQRLAIYDDRTNPETRKFILIYGEQHLQNIINWLKMT